MKQASHWSTAFQWSSEGMVHKTWPGLEQNLPNNMTKKIESLVGCIYDRKWYLMVHKDFVRAIITMNSHKYSL
jgi:hypothetical protein